VFNTVYQIIVVGRGEIFIFLMDDGLIFGGSSCAIDMFFLHKMEEVQLSLQY
jgi:hypothetical protein